MIVVTAPGSEALATDIRALGWTVAILDNLDNRFSDRSALWIVDLDTPPAANLQPLAKQVEAARGALLVVADSRAGGLDALIMQGATHYLPRPFQSADLARALLLAERHVDRLRGRSERRITREPTSRTESEGTVRKRVSHRLTANPSPLTLFLIAFTRFDMINAAFGRSTGDALLDAVAGRIEALLPANTAAAASLSRLAGTEFIVTLEGLRIDQQRALAEMIVDRVERPFLAEGHMVTIGCRIGIARSEPGDDATRLMRRAGAALANARASESATVCVVTSADEGAALFDTSLQADLRRALDRDEIEILFQPQLSVSTGTIVGVEALARWRHPDHGELAASTLFAVAERSDYLTALSGHVQQRAAAIAAAWPDALNRLRLAINLTAADIARPGFVEGFFAMIEATGFPRKRLTVEITESGLIDDLNRASNVLAQLRAGGCRVAIDDFGTGYSSLAYLNALPLDYLKIDKHLAQNIAGSSRDRVVVRGVIDMARALGLAVISEGVETDQQLALLAAEGCNYYQGFLFAEAVGVEELVRLVAG